MLLSGCVLLHGSASSVTFVKPAQQHLQFTAGFHDATRESIAYRNPSEYEEYDRVTGDARAEAILSVANGPQTSLDFPTYQLQSLTQSWRFNQQSARLDWGETHYLNDEHRSFTYALYRHRAAGKQRGCMAFLRSWASLPDDPRHRPGKAFFGYYCAPAGKRLDRPQAIALLRGITVSASDDIPRVYFGQDLPRNPRALNTARGRFEKNTGNSQFPFQFSRYYNIGGADNSLR